MNVYKKEYEGSCGGGLILIAAHNKIEADETAVRFIDSLVLRSNVVEADTYKFVLSNCSEAEPIPNLIHTGTKPETIVYNIYTE